MDIYTQAENFVGLTEIKNVFIIIPSQEIPTCSGYLEINDQIVYNYERTLDQITRLKQSKYNKIKLEIDEEIDEEEVDIVKVNKKLSEYNIKKLVLEDEKKILLKEYYENEKNTRGGHWRTKNSSREYDQCNKISDELLEKNVFKLRNC